MLSGDSEFDRVYSNFSSDATEPKHCNFSIVDLTARHTTIHEGEVGFFKSCIDLRELPKNPENDKKTDHTSAAWGQVVQEMAENLPIPIKQPKSKPPLPKNKKLESAFLLLCQFVMSVCVDNCKRSLKNKKKMGVKTKDFF